MTDNKYVFQEDQMVCIGNRIEQLINIHEYCIENNLDSNRIHNIIFQ